MFSHAPRILLPAGLMLLLGACAARPADSESRSPALSPGRFISPLGIELTIPPGWTARPNPDRALTLTHPGLPDASITLDIPDLPPHIPGLIPIALVRNGYVDDLRQKHPDLQTTDQPPPQIPNARSRLVHSTWPENSRIMLETALLMVHGDRVYILRANTPAPTSNQTLAAFTMIASSIRWR